MKAFCIGRNYSEHAKELGNSVPEDPVVFIKNEDCFWHEDLGNFVVPESVSSLHYEAEVVFKFAVDISSPLVQIPQADLGNILDQVTIGLDFTDREKQNELKQKGLPWEKAKAFKNSAMIGHFVFFEGGLFQHDNISFRFLINNNQVQIAHTNEMIFSVSDLVIHLSSLFPIKKNDLLFTGTPSGVGVLPPHAHIQAFLNNMNVLDIQL